LVPIGTGIKYQIRKVIKLGEIRLERFYCTFIIPISEGWLVIVSVEISEGDAKFLHAMKLVSPKDLGSIVHVITIH
jgi:hypothetical protein